MLDQDLRVASKRVTVRPFRMSDVDDRYLSWLNDSDVTRYSNQRFRTHDRASCERYVASFEGTFNQLLLISRQAGDGPIGTMTVYAAPPHGTADVGIMIGERSVWGDGYGQDAWTSVIEWLLGPGAVRKVTAGTIRPNVGMVRLMERSGMHLEATRRDHEIIDGQPVDILYYARFRDAG